MKEKELIKSILLGAHMSVAGGLYTAFERAERVSCTALQIFTKNSNQWNDPLLTPENIEKYRVARNKSKVKAVVSHGSYLINLCGATDKLLDRSRNSFVEEITRCHKLGIGCVVFHPGAHTTMERKEALKLVGESINYAHEKTAGFAVITAVETTAGQGTTIGSNFEEVAEIMSYVHEKNRLGVCIDTCHIFAAGYDITTKRGYDQVMAQFQDVVGIENLKVIHFNDAKKPLGSHIDRHEHIGKGRIGESAFGFILNDEKFDSVPKILETPKGDDGYKMDLENLGLLRSLIKALK